MCALRTGLIESGWFDGYFGNDFRECRQDGYRHAPVARGPDYIAFCDQDDIWDQKKLETMSEYLDENPEVQLVHSDLRLINESNDLITDSCWKHCCTWYPTGA